jgi:hypothetical protein
MKKHGFQTAMIFVLFSGLLATACRGTIYQEIAYPMITVSGSLPVIINGLDETDRIIPTMRGFYLHADPSIGGHPPYGIIIPQDGNWTTTLRKYNKETPVKFSVIGIIQRYGVPGLPSFTLTFSKNLGTETVFYEVDNVINFPEYPSVEFTVVPVSGSLRIIGIEGSVGATLTLYRNRNKENYFHKNDDDVCYGEYLISAKEGESTRWFTMMPSFTRFPEILVAVVSISGRQTQPKEITITGETDLLNIDLGEFVYTPRE